MPAINYLLSIAFVLLFLSACQPSSLEQEPPTTSATERVQAQFKNYDGLAETEVMIVGTLHFDESVLEFKNQQEIVALVDQLAHYQPTKIVLEWEPHLQSQTNERYQLFLKDSFNISERPNEVYQLGFRLARQLGHDSLFLFDDQTPFIGSLENFSFDSFSQYADANDAGFYDKYKDTLTTNFSHNQELLNGKGLAKHISLLNSPEMQHIDAQRMHMFEVRAGIQDNWIGADWLGRWYQRNIRMMGNVMKFSESGDRILILVGSNHKWTLDMLFGNAPDFRVASSWELLNQ